MSPLDLIGYSFMTLLAIGGAAGARLQTTGRLLVLSKTYPVLFYLALILGLANLFGIFYFSWAYFQWPHWLVFLGASIVLTPILGRTSHRVVLWFLFIVPGGLVLLAELLITGIIAW